MKQMSNKKEERRIASISSRNIEINEILNDKSIDETLIPVINSDMVQLEENENSNPFVMENKSTYATKGKENEEKEAITADIAHLVTMIEALHSKVKSYFFDMNKRYDITDSKIEEMYIVFKTLKETKL